MVVRISNPSAGETDKDHQGSGRSSGDTEKADQALGWGVCVDFLHRFVLFLLKFMIRVLIITGKGFVLCPLISS